MFHYGVETSSLNIISKVSTNGEASQPGGDTAPQTWIFEDKVMNIDFIEKYFNKKCS